MRIALSLIMVFIFSYLTPQQMPTDKAKTYNFVFKSKVDIDSLANNIINDYKDIINNRKFVSENDIYIDNLNRKQNKITNTININLERLKKKERAIIEVPCFKCWHDQKDSIVEENIIIDTLIIE